MNTIIRSVYVTIFLFASTEVSHTQGGETTPVYEGVVRVSGGADPNLPFTREFNVVYCSTNNGLTWNKTSVVARTVNPFAVTSKNLFSESDNATRTEPLSWISTPQKSDIISLHRSEFDSMRKNFFPDLDSTTLIPAPVLRP